MSSTTVYPNGDGTLGGWAISGGGTSNIYTTIDEGTPSPNDSDSIVCSTSASAYYSLLGDMPGDFGTATAVSIKVRAQYTSGKGNIKSFDCRLVQSDESTAITGNTTTAASGSLSTYTISPSITGGTSKSVWDGARLKLATVSGTSGGILVSAVQVEITYTAGASSTTVRRTLSLRGGSRGAIA